MRSDNQQDQRFRQSELWSFQRGTGGAVTNVIRNPEGAEKTWTAFSHSGNERNRLFMNGDGDSFANVSGVSGLDSSLDGRSFVTWDFNQDGLTDIGLVNANEPLLQLFENRSQSQDLSSRNRVIAVRLRGGNLSSQPHSEYSNRDAIGANLIVDTGEMKFRRVLSAGEGFASQNSKTLLIGLGDAESVVALDVIWPSGKISRTSDIPAGLLINIDELDGEISRDRYLPTGK